MTGETVAVSVVLHVWNGARYLDEAMRSIREQTHEALEICILDDGSTDRTVEIICAHADADPRIRWTSQPPNGRDQLHETFNRVVAMSTHDLVAIANADDVWMPNKVERQLAAFADDTKLDICWHDAVVIDGEDRWLRPTLMKTPMIAARTGVDVEAFRLGSPIPNPTVMFRRRLVDTIGPQRTGWMHDADWWLSAARAGCRFLGLPERLIKYRVHGASHSNSDDPGHHARFQMEHDDWVARRFPADP